jgi:ABC-type sugar transport system substrate-binding protein
VRIFRIAGLLIGLIAVLALAAGCSDDDEGDGGGGATTASSSNSNSAPASGGSAGADDVGAPVDVGPKTVAWVDLVGQASGASLVRESAADAAESLGWKFEAVDGGGDIQKTANLIDAAITRKVDAILVDAVPVQAIASQITKARDAGIDFVAISSGYDPNATFAINVQVAASSSTLGQYIAGRLKGEGKLIIVGTKTIPPAVLRESVLRATLSAFPGIEIVARHEVDLTDLVGDSQRGTVDMLQANSERHQAEVRRQALLRRIRGGWADARRGGQARWRGGRRSGVPPDRRGTRLDQHPQSVLRRREQADRPHLLARRELLVVRPDHGAGGGV